MTAVRTPTILVGVSGSPASAQALRWAADEARDRHGNLYVILAWSAQPRAYYAPVSGPHDVAEQARRATGRLTATLEAVLGDTCPPNLTMEVVEGNAARALVDRSAGADLLVLGSGRGIAADWIGPVIRGCLTNAHCPVVVVGPEGAPHCDPEDFSTSVTKPGATDRVLLAAGTGPSFPSS